MTQVVDAFVGLGSNLDGPEQQVRRALAALDGLPGTALHRASGLYASRPMGPADQPDYVNAVAWLRTVLAPDELLDELQALEAACGRQRDGMRWGPRPLDLDLLTWADRSCRSERLVLPHPGITERAFVLVPWAGIAPEFSPPGLAPVGELARRVDADGIWPLAGAPA